MNIINASLPPYGGSGLKCVRRLCTHTVTVSLHTEGVD